MAQRTIKLGGYVVPCSEVEDEYKNAIARHEYPGHNGADLESLGARATEHKLKAVFTAPQKAEWEGIKAFLKTGSNAVLEHFELGEIQVKIESVTVKHDQRIDTVEVDFNVVEDGVDAPATLARPAAIDVVASLAQTLVDAAVASTANQFLPAAVPVADLTDPTWLEKLGDLGAKAGAVVGALHQGLGRLDGMIAAFSYPVTTALNALSFAADLPSQFALRLARVLDLMQGKVAGSADPAASTSRFLRDAGALADQFRGTPLEGTARLMVAAQGVRTVATVMASDEDRLRAMRAYETATPFDENGRWIAQAAAPTQLPATATQMAFLVGQARRLVQAARPWMEEPHALDRVAVALQDQYNDRLVEFEQLREIVVAEPTPLHLVCHRNGLPYNAAERVALLNPQIRNPTFTQGRILIYAP